MIATWAANCNTLTLFTHSHGTRTFSHTVQNKVITDNVATENKTLTVHGQTRQRSTVQQQQVIQPSRESEKYTKIYSY